MNNDEAWVSEKLTELKSALITRFGEKAVKITNYCIEEQKVLEVDKQLDDLRKENKDLSDKLYVKKYVEDMMQHVLMKS